MPGRLHLTSFALLRVTLAVFAVLSAGCGGAAAPERPELVVFAAASLRDVASELATGFEEREGTHVVFNFAGSNTLAQQIDAAPVADVFLSADGEWVDFLDGAGHTVPGSRRPFLANRLVVVAHREAAFEITAPSGLAAAPYHHLAMAAPDAVPAGRYARAALERLPWEGGSLWDAVAARVAPTLDVRAALALVESQPQIVGIVYATDAATSERVRALFELPSPEESPILYWAVLVDDGGNPEAARRFLDFLGGPEAQAVARRHGFVSPDRTSPLPRSVNGR